MEVASEDLDRHAKDYLDFVFYTKDPSKVFWREKWHSTTCVLVLKVKASGRRGSAILKNKRLEVKKEVIQIIKERNKEKMTLLCSTLEKEITEILVKSCIVSQLIGHGNNQIKCVVLPQTLFQFFFSLYYIIPLIL